MMIRGYKAFNKNMCNRYGMKFDVGVEYSVLGPVSFGNTGNGYHFCERLEDTLRYVDAMNDEVKIAEVIGSGDVREMYDDYYGYYDMYVVSNLEIIRVLDREEIIDQFLMLPGYRVERFVKGFRLTDDELVNFKDKYMNEMKVLQAISYYQEGDTDAYNPEKAYTYMKLRRDS